MALHQQQALLQRQMQLSQQRTTRIQLHRIRLLFNLLLLQKKVALLLAQMILVPLPWYSASFRFFLVETCGALLDWYSAVFRQTIARTIMLRWESSARQSAWHFGLLPLSQLSSSLLLLGRKLKMR